jgi:hypothetical protein
VELFYDERDDAAHEARGSQILYWLDDLGARPLTEAKPNEQGFLFAGARAINDYRQLVAPFPKLADRPSDREPLLRLDRVLDALSLVRVSVPQPRTWRLALDAPLPADLTYPLFLRTAESSWKRGGLHGRVANERELEAEAADLRRHLGWDALVLAREWLELSPAGEARHGPVPQEVRIWIVDGKPIAWSFHHLHLLPHPNGFPPTKADLAELSRLAAMVGKAFRSRLVVADFARLVRGGWCFIEAGPGSCAGTAHEAVFKSVAQRLQGGASELEADNFGGPLPPAD